ncbi:hypothetical protein C8A05DRAFT_20324 [Staphylotrichum tortipilum]|uniref:Uncharacterized protein n=1 Tax=Staphylotrichum tortipilum TaxID=2831512 RepID=A0AAN6RMB9_9PEZI|nr:hypothetical protein C8A05DRAFT_20324 [Staphylotrichum longicolle]
MVASALAGAPNPTLASKLISWKHLTDARSSFKPDWAVLDHNLSKKYHHAHKDDGAKYLVYAVGDSKLKQKWKSAWLSHPDSALTVPTDAPYHKPGTPVPNHQQSIYIAKERLLPLRQLASYCRYSETRYAYLLTQTELVALRVRRIASNTNEHSAAIEYRAIPWSAHGQNKLTAHLAIWALGCMGMNDGHRAMEGPQKAVLTDMAKLTWWTKNEADGSFTNVISHRVIPGGEWTKLTAGTTVHTDDAGGRSLTSTFTAAPPLPDLTQKMANLKLGSGAAKNKPQPPAAPKSLSHPPAAAASKSSSHPPAAAAPKKSYTKCTIGKTKYNVSEDPKGHHYVVLDNKMKVQYTIVQNAAKKWVVKEDPKLVVVKME